MSDVLLPVFLHSSKSLRLMLMSRLANEQDVEDLMQEIFLHIADRHDLATIDNPRAYLWRIATNAAVDRLRDTQRRSRLFTIYEAAFEHLPDGAATPEDDAHIRSCISEIKKVIGELNPNCRRAFLLSRRDGLDYKEIANIMGVSPHMVKKHLVHALGALRLGLSQ